MVGSFGNGFGFVMYSHHFPNRHTMPLEIRFAASGRIAKTDAREFLLQRLFLQVQAAESGNFQVTPFRLARQQGGVICFNPA